MSAVSAQRRSGDPRGADRQRARPTSPVRESVQSRANPAAELRVLDRASPRAAAERARRRARLGYFACGLMLAASLLIVAVAQAMAGSAQVRLDVLRSEVSGAVSTDQSLALRAAELESPARILRIAEGRLDLVSPTSVSYLRPLPAGTTVAERAAASRARTTAHGSRPRSAQ
jgi:F0F1-type ATP synthase membrane subunit c/vacuolar-type H+-ATPase subunit K